MRDSENHEKEKECDNPLSVLPVGSNPARKILPQVHFASQARDVHLYALVFGLYVGGGSEIRSDKRRVPRNQKDSSLRSVE